MAAPIPGPNRRMKGLGERRAISAGLKDPGDDIRRRAALDELQDPHFAATAFDKIRANDVPGALGCFRIVVATFDKDGRLDRAYQLVGGLLIEERDVVDGAERCDYPRTILLRDDRTTGPLEPLNGRIGVETDHENIAQRASRLQVTDVPSVEY